MNNGEKGDNLSEAVQKEHPFMKGKNGKNLEKSFFKRSSPFFNYEEKPLCIKNHKNSGVFSIVCLLISPYNNC